MLLFITAHPEEHEAQFQPWHLLLLILAGWINRRQQDAIEYLLTENRVLREKLGRNESCSTTTSAGAWLSKARSSGGRCSSSWPPS